jgi:cysteine desulfurase
MPRGHPWRPSPYALSIVVYLDNNATTQPTPAVVEAVSRGLEQTWHNPSSTHRAGQGARAQVELARRDVAALIGVRARELTFTSSGTESIDLAIRGVINAWRSRGEEARNSPARLITTRIEHAAVRELAVELEHAQLATAAYAPVTREGVVDVDGLAAILAQPGFAFTIVSSGPIEVTPIATRMTARRFITGLPRWRRWRRRSRSERGSR